MKPGGGAYLTSTTIDLGIFVGRAYLTKLDFNHLKIYSMITLKELIFANGAFGHFTGIKFREF